MLLTLIIRPSPNMDIQFRVTTSNCKLSMPNSTLLTLETTCSKVIREYCLVVVWDLFYTKTRRSYQPLPLIPQLKVWRRRQVVISYISKRSRKIIPVQSPAPSCPPFLPHSMGISFHQCTTDLAATAPLLCLRILPLSLLPECKESQALPQRRPLPLLYKKPKCNREI